MSAAPLPGVPERPTPALPATGPGPMAFSAGPAGAASAGARAGAGASAGASVGAGASAGAAAGPEGQAGSPATFDPLRLCIFTTVALLAWLFGPFAVLVFAALGFAGYAKARRAGLTRSQCYLRDTRLVLAYLGLVALAAAAGIVVTVSGWLG